MSDRLELFHSFYSSKLSLGSFIFESFHYRFKANIFFNVSKLSWNSVSKHPSWFILWFLIVTLNTQHLALLHHPHLLCVSIVTNIHTMATTSDPVTLICSLQSKSAPSLSPYIWSLSPGSPILSDGHLQSGVRSNALISTQAHLNYVPLHAFLQNTMTFTVCMNRSSFQLKLEAVKLVSLFT